MEAKNVDLTYLNRTIQEMGYGTANIHADDTFDKIGMDSYAVLDLILEVETQCNLVIEDARILQMETLQDILDAVHEKNG